MIMNYEMEEMWGEKVTAFFVRGLFVWRHDTLLATVLSSSSVWGWQLPIECTAAYRGLLY
jgi:hypothetical protein